MINDLRKGDEITTSPRKAHVISSPLKL